MHYFRPNCGAFFPPVIQINTWQHLQIAQGYISAFYNISQPNFAILLILTCSFFPAVVIDFVLLPRSKFSL
jgi:hypothetical protein